MSHTSQHPNEPIHYKPRFGVDEASINETNQKFPRGSNTYAYGTAGFRMKADLLPHVVFRIGLLATDDNGAKIIDWDGGMLSMDWEPCATSLVNTPDSELLTAVRALVEQRAKSWPYIKRLPKHAPSAAYETQFEEVASRVGLTNSRPAEHEMSGSAQVSEEQMAISTHAPVVLVGRDTRPSSAHLAELTRLAAKALGAHVIDYGTCTTPQLHWCVGEMNRRMELNGKNMSFELNTPKLCNYISVLAEAFRMVRRNSISAVKSSNGDRLSNCEFSVINNSKMLLDCADGVGGKAAEELKVILCKNSNPAPLSRTDEIKGCVARQVPFSPGDFYFINTGATEPGEELLSINFECGAEYVQKQRRLPKGVRPDELLSLGADSTGVTHNQLCASMDGDADRVVFFYIKPKSDNLMDGYYLRLLDGDKIMALLAQYLSILLDKAELSSKLRLGLVQTAYANGASTRYMQNMLKLNVAWARTGVKYLHVEAKKFDIGIYFEANGHGTVLFNEKAREMIRIAVEAEIRSGDSIRAKALKQLIALQQLINPYIGDALSDWLLTHAALCEVFGSHLCGRMPSRPTELIELWDSMYEDLPSVMDKACVPDRSLLVVSEDERTCLAPEGLQEMINREVELVRQVEQRSGGKNVVARSFVRASGTENIVRIFAEASTLDLAKELCEKVKAHVLNICR